MTKARILADYVAGGTTAAEFDYMDGVTSNVQTQLDAKLPLAGGTMTGNIVMGDDTSIGISDSDERIEFDGAGDISVLGAKLGIGANPLGPTHSYIPSGNAFSTAWNGWGGDNLILHNNVGAGNGYVGGAISFCAPTGSAGGADAQRGAAIAGIQTSADQDQIGLVFYTHPTDAHTGAIAEAMRIRHDSLISTLGNLSLAGSTTSTDSFSASGTSGTYRLGVAFANDGQSVAYMSNETGTPDDSGILDLAFPQTNNATGAKFIQFHDVSQVQGTISCSGTSHVTYTATSDYRLKTKLSDIIDPLNKVNQLKPIHFKWKKADELGLPEEKQDGFFAHEVAEVVPVAVVGEKDGMNPEILYNEDDELPEGKSIGDVKREESMKAQQMDMTCLIPILVGAIQELSIKVTALESA